MNFIKDIHLILSFLFLENFFYKYYLGVNSFINNKKEKLNKEKASLDFVIVLLGSLAIFEVLKLVMDFIIDSDMADIILLILSSYLMIVAYNNFIRRVDAVLYFFINNILILGLLNINFDSYYYKIMATIVLGLFNYLNFYVLFPLLKNLSYKKRPEIVSKEALTLLVIGLIGLIFNAFTGY